MSIRVAVDHVEKFWHNSWWVNDKIIYESFIVIIVTVVIGKRVFHPWFNLIWTSVEAACKSSADELMIKRSCSLFFLAWWLAMAFDKIRTRSTWVSPYEGEGTIWRSLTLAHGTTCGLVSECWCWWSPVVFVSGLLEFLVHWRGSEDGPSPLPYVWRQVSRWLTVPIPHVQPVPGPHVVHVTPVVLRSHRHKGSCICENQSRGKVKTSHPHWRRDSS